MTTVRVTHDKERPYFVANKEYVSDPNLSWGAKGLFTFLLAQEDNWKVIVKYLASIYQKRGGGEEAIYGYLEELMEAGYCQRSYVREKGKFKQLSYTIFEKRQDLKNLQPQGGKNPDSENDDEENDAVPLGEEEENPPFRVLPQAAKNPESPQGGKTVSGSTGSGKPGSLISNNNKDIKKQQQLAAAASFEHEEKFSKIDHLPISKTDKEDLSKKFSIEQIDHIVEFYERKKKISPNYVPASWISILNSCVSWPLPELPETKKPQKTFYSETDDEFIENKRYAEEVEKNYWRLLDRQSESFFVSNSGFIEYENSKKHIKKQVFFKSFTFKEEMSKLIELIKEEMKKRN